MSYNHVIVLITILERKQKFKIGEITSDIATSIDLKSIANTIDEAEIARY